jgi:hypothetical protein
MEEAQTKEGLSLVRRADPEYLHAYRGLTRKREHEREELFKSECLKFQTLTERKRNDTG